MPADMYDRVNKNADFARDKLASRMPEKLAAPADGRLETTANEPQPARIKLVPICGPWSSGTSAVAGILERIGCFGVGPYFETADPKTPNSYEFHPVSRDCSVRTRVSKPTHLCIPRGRARCSAVGPTRLARSHRATGVRTLRSSFSKTDIPQISAIGIRYPADLRSVRHTAHLRHASARGYRTNKASPKLASLLRRGRGQGDLPTHVWRIKTPRISDVDHQLPGLAGISNGAYPRHREIR